MAKFGGGAKFFHGFAEGVEVAATGDKAVFAVGHQFARAALIGYDAGQAGSLGFEDDVAKGVRGAGKHKGVGGGEFRAVQISGENRAVRPLTARED